ncbi:hypothetical protein CKO31_25555 [Thiohalocapsa halophila]|uniref:Uncharacterized protein n=1 Tax=Thiohalocapsa halophila TaxID=69359 RepID=A0ABS1CQ05_9GAMM|nr:hypothetical protein [Thiohalocapsa halophila]MBK1634024.1 hypothetical protein [Thiohalocapsa halophila]
MADNKVRIWAIDPWGNGQCVSDWLDEAAAEDVVRWLRLHWPLASYELEPAPAEHDPELERLVSALGY